MRFLKLLAVDGEAPAWSADRIAYQWAATGRIRFSGASDRGQCAQHEQYFRVSWTI